MITRRTRNLCFFGVLALNLVLALYWGFYLNGGVAFDWEQWTICVLAFVILAYVSVRPDFGRKRPEPEETKSEEEELTGSALLEEEPTDPRLVWWMYGAKLLMCFSLPAVQMFTMAHKPVLYYLFTALALVGFAGSLYLRIFRLEQLQDSATSSVHALHITDLIGESGMLLLFMVVLYITINFRTHSNGISGRIVPWLILAGVPLAVALIAALVNRSTESRVDSSVRGVLVFAMLLFLSGVICFSSVKVTGTADGYVTDVYHARKSVTSTVTVQLKDDSRVDLKSFIGEYSRSDTVRLEYKQANFGLYFTTMTPIDDPDFREE